MKETFKLTGAFDLAGPPFCSETEIFRRAYGDPDGREYWREWLFHPHKVDQLADLIATHIASSASQSELIKARVEAQLALIELSNTGEAVNWLIANPDTTDFICDSLKKYQSAFEKTDNPPPASPVALDKGAKTPKVKKTPGRPPGTGFQNKDAVLCEKMQELIDSGEVSSVCGAAKKVLPHARKTPQAKIKRLSKLFMTLKKNNCAAVTLSTQNKATGPRQPKEF